MDTPLWIQMWEQKFLHIIIFSVFLTLIISIMLFKDSLSKKKATLDILKYGILGISFIYVGLILKAQPTTTNIIIMVTAQGFDLVFFQNPQKFDLKRQ